MHVSLHKTNKLKHICGPLCKFGQVFFLLILYVNVSCSVAEVKEKYIQAKKRMDGDYGKTKNISCTRASTFVRTLEKKFKPNKRI